MSADSKKRKGKEATKAISPESTPPEPEQHAEPPYSLEDFDKITGGDFKKLLGCG